MAAVESGNLVARVWTVAVEGVYCGRETWPWDWGEQTSMRRERGGHGGACWSLAAGNEDGHDIIAAAIHSRRLKEINVRGWGRCPEAEGVQLGENWHRGLASIAT
ncbi:hypothetical protein Hypma_016170 [Hypsizygus marmoreus]|uniref:Uncharacterized protein n=1 Tax=Hypsizygus marmoreus TaxID=39966 RepID=A0A369IYZ1_HYPMA|nr:hypothetical protein Hypma_016170 [Hypsizygus marmoreus]